MTTLLRVQEKLGKSRPQTDSEWEAYSADKKARRAKNVVNAREILDRNGIVYAESANDHGIMFRLCKAGSNSVIWYYPEDGRWYVKGEPVHFGCRNLVRFLKGACT